MNNTWSIVYSLSFILNEGAMETSFFHSGFPRKEALAEYRAIINRVQRIIIFLLILHQQCNFFALYC